MLIKKLFGLICLLFVTAGITFAQGTPSLSINDITVPEGDSSSTLVGWDFTISLSAPSTQTVSVTVSTQAASATETSILGRLDRFEYSSGANFTIRYCLYQGRYSRGRN